jgi:hypothetical protein
MMTPGRKWGERSLLGRGGDDDGEEVDEWGMGGGTGGGSTRRKGPGFDANGSILSPAYQRYDHRLLFSLFMRALILIIPTLDSSDYTDSPVNSPSRNPNASFDSPTRSSTRSPSPTFVNNSS